MVDVIFIYHVNMYTSIVKNKISLLPIVFSTTCIIWYGCLCKCIIVSYALQKL